MKKILHFCMAHTKDVRQSDCFWSLNMVVWDAWQRHLALCWDA